MKSKRTNRSRRQNVCLMECLETRSLLSATATAAIPTQTLTLGSISNGINLGSFFNDPGVTGTAVLLATPLGNIPLVLTDSQTPQTVANFTQYITSGEYANTVFHRSVPGFVLQGGGYETNGAHIQTNGTIPGEHSESNTTGTIAMALSSGPDSATSEWFINLANNNGTGSTPNLDDTSDGGPFTAFGSVVYNGMSVVNAIAALPIVNDSTQSGAFNTLPVQSGTNGQTVLSEPASNLVTINPTILPGGLMYTVASSAPGVIAASVDAAGRLTLHAVGAGTGATITITATDMGGGTASTSFAVNELAQVSIGNAAAVLTNTHQINFPVTLSAPSNFTTTLSYTLTAGTAPGSDFQSTGSTLTIPAGTASASIPVTVIGDTNNAPESFTITLSSLSNNANFASGASTEAATGTISPTLLTTQIGVAPAAGSVIVGNTDALTATITTPANSPVPTGTVNFLANGVSIGTAGIVGGTASLSPSYLTIGNETITGVYSGDAVFAGGMSLGTNVEVDNAPALTPTVVRSSLPTSLVGGIGAPGVTAISLTNDSGSTEKGRATINLYASPDGVVDGSSILIATGVRVVNLKATRSVVVALANTKAKSALPAGAYTLLAQAVDPAGTPSNSATGRTISVAVPVVTLSATNAVARPPKVTLGKSGLLYVTITNSGNIASSGAASIEVGVSADGQTEAFSLTDTTRTLRLPPRGRVVIAVRYTVSSTATAGTYNPFFSITEDGSFASTIGSSTLTLLA